MLKSAVRVFRTRWPLVGRCHGCRSRCSIWRLLCALLEALRLAQPKDRARTGPAVACSATHESAASTNFCVMRLSLSSTMNRLVDAATSCSLTEKHERLTKLNCAGGGRRVTAAKFPKRSVLNTRVNAAVASDPRTKLRCAGSAPADSRCCRNPSEQTQTPR